MQDEKIDIDYHKRQYEKVFGVPFEVAKAHHKTDQEEDIPERLED